METGSELSKTVATFIVQKILLDDSGLSYICATPARFYAVSSVLATMVQQLVSQPSQRLLKHIIRCYLRLADNPRCVTFSLYFRMCSKPNAYFSVARLFKAHSRSTFPNTNLTNFHNSEGKLGQHLSVTNSRKKSNVNLVPAKPFAHVFLTLSVTTLLYNSSKTTQPHHNG
jgi:hypothetical protein